MNRRARNALLALFFLGLLVESRVSAQILIQPTPLPAVTAENEPWYLGGEPITYAGNLYYPAGAQIFFNSNEMVRSGFYMGIPLYARTTIEPYSVVYVPLAGGRMQPYERPRTGEIAGTSGSTPTTLPTPGSTVPPAGLAPQAAGPPSQTVTVVPIQVTGLPERSTGSLPGPPAAAPEVVGTSGRTPSAPRPLHTRIGGRPQGTNAIFIEFQNIRWYPVGPARLIETAGMRRVGDYAGFDVWSSSEAIVYVPVTKGSTLAVPYSRTRRE
jgi:hypothetical protein